MQISIFLKDIQYFIHELGIVQRIIFSFVVLYGSLTLSFVLFYILSTFRRLNINKALENANIYLISLILLIAGGTLIHFSRHKEVVLICLFTITVFFILLIEVEKRYRALQSRFKDALASLNSMGKIDSNALWFTYVKKNYFRFVKEYHLFFWIALIVLEIISDEPYGVGSLFKSTVQLWNDTAVIGVAFSLLAFFIVLHLLVVWIADKQSVGQESQHE